MGNIVAFVLVGLAAVGAAAAVYGITTQRGASMRDRLADSAWRTRPVSRGSAPTGSDPGGAPFAAEPPSAPGPGAAYLPVVSSGSSWHTKVIGIVGLVLLVSVGAVLLALSVYAGGSMLVRLLTHATHTG